MLSEAIILAGGFGTRLQEVVNNVPKPMAPVNGKPFLNYIFSYLKHFGITHVVLSTGYLAEKISDYYQTYYQGITVSYATEESPLGTGGGIRLAMEKCRTKQILVLNGDSFFDVDVNLHYQKHTSLTADYSLALRKVNDAARYGTILLNHLSAVTAFKEKDGIAQEGLINGGVYILNKEVFMRTTPSNTCFSIEKDVYEKQVHELNITGFEYQGYFIDIGIPEDYKKAQHDFKRFAYR